MGGQRGSGVGAAARAGVGVAARVGVGAAARVGMGAAARVGMGSQRGLACVYCAGPGAGAGMTPAGSGKLPSKGGQFGTGRSGPG